MNSLMTGGRHHAWRVGSPPRAPPARRPDPRSISPPAPPTSRSPSARRTPGRFVVGADFSEAMLRQVGARRKLRERRVARVELLAADALALPFRDGAFACVMSAFLLRNLETSSRAGGDAPRDARGAAASSRSRSCGPACAALGRDLRRLLQSRGPAIGAVVARRSRRVHLSAAVGRSLRHAGRARRDDGATSGCATSRIGGSVWARSRSTSVPCSGEATDAARRWLPATAKRPMLGRRERPMNWRHRCGPTSSSRPRSRRT